MSPSTLLHFATLNWFRLCVFVFFVFFEKRHSVRVRIRSRFDLKMAVLVPTIADGDGPTVPRQTDVCSPQKWTELSLDVLKKKGFGRHKMSQKHL